MIEIGQALAAAKTAYDLALTALAARDEAKVKSAMADLQAKLWDASTIGFTQLQALHALELESQKLRMELAEAHREKQELETKLREQTQYDRFEIVAGAWAYTAKSDIKKPVQSRPNFCPICHSSGKTIPLQYAAANDKRGEAWHCPADPGHTIRNRSAQYDPKIGMTTHWMS